MISLGVTVCVVHSVLCGTTCTFFTLTFTPWRVADSPSAESGPVRHAAPRARPGPPGGRRAPLAPQRRRRKCVPHSAAAAAPSSAPSSALGPLHTPAQRSYTYSCTPATSHEPEQPLPSSTPVPARLSDSVFTHTGSPTRRSTRRRAVPDYSRSPERPSPCTSASRRTVNSDQARRADAGRGHGPHGADMRCCCQFAHLFSFCVYARARLAYRCVCVASQAQHDAAMLRRQLRIQRRQVPG